jgi:hypothetical protein
MILVTQRLNSHCNPFAATLFVLCFLFVSAGWAFSENGDCSAVKTRWEDTFRELKAKLQDFQTLQQIHVEKIVQRPLIDRSENKSIARQVSDALQIKEDMLNARRKECKNLFNLENQIFGELQECIQGGKGAKDKEVKSLLKQRQAIVEKGQIAISEIQEVEGKDTIIPYSDAMRDQDPYARSVNNYWQNYQQMYRRWWGH